MSFTVFNNNKMKTLYVTAPGETLLFSEYGQLLIANANDNSVVAVPKRGDYVIVFENDNELPLGATIRLIY